MRLTRYQVNAIKDVFSGYFKPDDHLWLFGSRVDDDKRGGDIDLYIETNETDKDWVFKTRRAFVIELKHTIGDQKIDVIVKHPGSTPQLIHQEARETGVLLT